MYLKKHLDSNTNIWA